MSLVVVTMINNVTEITTSNDIGVCTSLMNFQYWAYWVKSVAEIALTILDLIVSISNKLDNCGHKQYRKMRVLQNSMPTTTIIPL